MQFLIDMCDQATIAIVKGKIKISYVETCHFMFVERRLDSRGTGSATNATS